MSTMKPIHAQWVVGLCGHLKNKADAVKKKKSFEIRGITYCIDKDDIEIQWSWLWLNKFVSSQILRKNVRKLSVIKIFVV